MKYAWLGCILLASTLFAGTEAANSNVNTRYKVETVVVAGDGWLTEFGNTANSGQVQKISPGLVKRITALVGDKLNPSALEEIGKRLRREFHTSDVTHHVTRGDSPSFVRVVYDVGNNQKPFDVSVPKFLYNSRQGWSAAVETTTTIKQNSFSFGLVSDGDELAERYAGLRARYENSRIAGERVRLVFLFDSYHDQWNQATLDQFQTSPGAVPVSGLNPLQVTSAPYRSRQVFEPEVTFTIAEPLTVSAGVSFERLQEAYPSPHTEAANAVIGGAHYRARTEKGSYENSVDADYALRAGTGALESDLIYARHAGEVRYALGHGKHVLADEFSAGMISGRAPLFERFFLGNSSTLRGWNKFDVAPLGGNRMVHNSVEYRYGILEVFYDTGSVWDAGQPTTPRHGLGVGLRQGSFALALAFPVRSGRVEPTFMMGMNY
jgi:hypothetical protein